VDHVNEFPWHWTPPTLRSISGTCARSGT
jgi:hypothetical protein